MIRVSHCRLDRKVSYYILSVYSPFSNGVGLPLYNIPFSGVLMKSIGAEFYDRMPILCQAHAYYDMCIKNIF